MRFLTFSVLAFVYLTTFSVSAVDVAYDGYFRARGNMYYNLDLDRDRATALRTYSDLRFRLNPTFFITDKIRIKSSLNFLDGPVGDTPFRGGASANPAVSNDTLLDPKGVQTKIGRSIDGQATSVYGGVYLPDGATQSADLKPIQLRRAWLEWDTGLGTLMLGRMPHQFGMGIYANAGDDPFQEIGSSRDRLVFDTSFGNYYVRPGIGWISEGKLDQTADDFMEYFFVFGRKTETQDIGFYLSYSSQDHYQPDPALAAGTLVGAETSYWVFDFYVQNDFDIVNAQAEVVLYSGKYLGQDLLAVNSAGRLDWKFGKFSMLNEAGYSMGSDAGNLAANDLHTVPFSRDYDISMLVFEEALPGGKNMFNSSGTPDATSAATAPHSGAISNALYGRLKLNYDVVDFFQPSINVVVPVAAKLGAPGVGGRFYGVEYDLITRWPINRYITGDFSFGHFIPGSFYDKVSQSHSVVLLRAGLIAKF